MNTCKEHGTTYVKAIFLIAICIFLLSCQETRDKSAAVTDNTDTAYSGAKYNDHIRFTNAQTPEEERKGFKLPEGFEINLYASEPDIGKPINFNFDARGRMWVTQSFEYPFPAVPGKGRDRLTILEDTDNDGKADRFTHFDDTLNIPIGIMPVEKGAVVYSIPNIIRFDDAENKGKPDSSHKLFGPFEVKDTHGMVNNFTTGFDGWIHACHGYTNRSDVAGTDGDSIHLVSGNTIRFKPDGSRVEHETKGRINPFGLVYDELGYLYSTDCHTSPLYQMIRGGDYSQWGKDEGMGFAPDMKPFSNEATALAGIAYYADKKWPDEYKKNLFIGDVVASRVYRNSFVFKGSSPVGKREPDFIKSLDPWFRPVAVQIGPDGAMYIADFYNSIIGHYEVPLYHPKRDKIRGRIWRVTYKGKADKKTDWTKATIEELFKALNADNLRVRMTAGDQLVDHYGNKVIEPIKALITRKGTTQTEYVQGLWALQRLGALNNTIARTALLHTDPVIRLHTLRALAEQKDTAELLYPLVLKALKDTNAHVTRAAVELLSQYPVVQTAETLIAFSKTIDKQDTHLYYTTRLILRNLLRNDNIMKTIISHQWEKEESAFLASILPGVENAASGLFLFRYMNNGGIEGPGLSNAFKHIIRFIPGDSIGNVISTAIREAARYPKLEYRIFSNLTEGLVRRGAKQPQQLTAWGKDISIHLLKNYGSDTMQKDMGAVQFAVSLAGDYHLTQLYPQLEKLYNDTSISSDIRSNTLRSMLKLHPEKNVEIADKLLADSSTNTEYKRQMVAVLTEFPSKTLSNTFARVKNAPPDLQWWIIMALASSSYGNDLLLEKVRSGDLMPRNIAEPKIEERILLNTNAAQQKKYRNLTADLGSVDIEKQTLINKRIDDFTALTSKPSADNGRIVFMKNCIPCHAIKGEGGHVGPQLDGVGKWGVTSLMEKILDPNRNVSENFRNYTVKLKDGKTLSGLYRRDEGQALIFVDILGREFSISKKEIAEKTPSKYTLMPDQFRNTIPVNNFNELVAFLLTQKSD